jgi:hypothetical protein
MIRIICYGLPINPKMVIFIMWFQIRQEVNTIYLKIEENLPKSQVILSTCINILSEGESMSNENLRKARQIKNDEFYTQYQDIEAELSHYKEQFYNKIIYCNCDTPQSNFVKFLKDVQDEWGIKDVWHSSLEEGISFESPQAKEMLLKCDIVITNPPFSLTRAKFMPLLIESGKQFLFIGNLNMATYKEVFPLIRDGKLWTGYTHPKQFMQSDGTFKNFGNTLWWTNLDVDKPFSLDPEKKYYGNESKYPHYDNYDAINVDRLVDIPSDFGGVMGVPVTFIEHYTPPEAQTTNYSA